VTRFLQVVDAEGASPTDASLAFDDELVDYFAALEGFPAFARLADLAKAGAERIEETERRALAEELAPLAAAARSRTLPEPPAWVGLEGGTDIRLGEELGWGGLLRYLQQLERLLHLAARLGGEVALLEE
jgi:hypothetical protein